MIYKGIKGKITAFLLATSMVFSLSSCGLIIVNDVSDKQDKTEDEDNRVEEKNDDASAETTISYVKYTASENGLELSREYMSKLPKRDYEGAVFFITTPSSDYIAPEDTLTSVSKLSIERNAMVEELLNVEIITSVENTDTMLTNVKQAIASDSYYSDLLMIPIYMIGQFRKDETILNLRTLPFFDIDQPYFNKESSEMTSGGYTTYGVAGHASISPSSFSVVYMNKPLLEMAGVEPATIYDMAEDGEWTWDELLKCTSAVASLNESGQAGREFYTITAQNTASRLPDLIFKASGNDFIRAGKRRIPTLGFNERTAKTTLDNIATIYNDPKSITDPSAGAIGCFSSGESAFLIDYLSIMPDITNADADWGLLPLPKQEEGDDYRTLISNSELVFAVPKNHTNGEFAAITLSALNAASYGYIYDEYVNYSMLNVLRDNDSVNMLDMLLDTASFDFALAFGNAYPEIADATYKLIRATAKSNDLADKFGDLMIKANAVMSKEFDLRY